MKTYTLVLESGPKKKKTYVHVLDLPGCMARGDTTEAALDATPAAIREYLTFLQRHGEAVDPAEGFTTEVAQHLMEGYFLGNGTLTIDADHEPLSAEEVERAARWLLWMFAELKGCVAQLPSLDDAPERGRPIRAILQHIVGTEREYLRMTFGGDTALNAIAKAAEKNEGDLLELLGRLREIGAERLREMTPDERSYSRQAGQQIWTARKMVRRMLEHGWEHFREIAARVGEAGSGRLASG